MTSIQAYQNREATVDATNYTEHNRAAWNQVTPIHQQHRKSDLQAAVQAADFSVLDEIEYAAKPTYAFAHTLADIFTALLKNSPDHS
jgi:hypothetical protein